MRESRPTPRQVAYLDYLGIEGARSMTFEEASARLDEVDDYCLENPDSDLAERRNGWFLDRFRLHLDLYREKLFELVMYSEDSYRSYVRARVVGASEKLTRERIETVVRSLLAEDTFWWDGADANERFFRQLGESFPGCVDGRPPKRREKTSAARASPTWRALASHFEAALIGFANAVAILICIFGGAVAFAVFGNLAPDTSLTRPANVPLPEPSPAPEAETHPPRAIPPPLPTAMRVWESADGRTALGSVIEIDVEAETVTLRLADGQEFFDYPIVNFSEEGQAFLLGRPSTTK